MILKRTKHFLLMKKRLFFAAMCGMVLTLASCVKDDDLELFKHPIHVQGEVDPHFGIPLSSGEMTFGDLLSNFSSTFAGYIDENESTITFIFEDSTYGSFGLGAKSRAVARPRAKDGNPLDDVWFRKDTTISQKVAIGFFENIEELNHIEIGNLLMNLRIGVHGEYRDNDTSMQSDLRVSFRNVRITYRDNRGMVRDFIPGSGPLFDSIAFNDLAKAWQYRDFDSVQMAQVANRKPSEVEVHFGLTMELRASHFFSNPLDTVGFSIQDSSLTQIINHVKMMRFDYMTKLGVTMPVELGIRDLQYNFDINLGEGLSNLNLDSIVHEIDDSISADIESAKLTFAFENGLPFDLDIEAQCFKSDGTTAVRYYDEDGHRQKLTFFGDSTIDGASVRAIIDPTTGLPTGIHEVSQPTASELSTSLTKNKLTALSEAKTMRVILTLNSTNNKVVRVSRNDKLKLRAYLKFHPSIHFDIPITTEGLL